MSLHVIRNKADLGNIPFFDCNDLYFSGQILNDNDITRKVLKDIDNAEYNDVGTFIGRDASLGALNKEHLSTGCKTLVNIINNPDKCFSLAECGQNALQELSFITDGYVLWENQMLFMLGDVACDLICDGQHYSSFKQFLHRVMN